MCSLLRRWRSLLFVRFASSLSSFRPPCLCAGFISGSGRKVFLSTLDAWPEIPATFVARNSNFLSWKHQASLALTLCSFKNVFQVFTLRSSCLSSERYPLISSVDSLRQLTKVLSLSWPNNSDSGTPWHSASLVRHEYFFNWSKKWTHLLSNS